MKYVPSFPFSTKYLKYLGIDLELVQPPMPEGKGSLGELAGTNEWHKLVGFSQTSRNTSLAWADMSQQDENGEVPDEYENFFPGLRRWNIAVKMPETHIHFPSPETWETPRWLV